MARSNARAAVAAEQYRLSRQAATFRADVRHALRWLDGNPAVAEAIGHIEHVESILFTVASEVESGRLPIAEFGQDPRPLFDKTEAKTKVLEAKPEPEPEPEDDGPIEEYIETEPGDWKGLKLKTVEECGPGTELNRCGRCNALRLRNIPICPRCSCPEYELCVIDEAREVVRQMIEEPRQFPNDGTPLDGLPLDDGGSPIEVIEAPSKAKKARAKGGKKSAGPSWDILADPAARGDGPRWVARIWADTRGDAWGLANLAFPGLNEKFRARKASAKFYMEGTVGNEKRRYRLTTDDGTIEAFDMATAEPVVVQEEGGSIGPEIKTPQADQDHHQDLYFLARASKGNPLYLLVAPGLAEALGYTGTRHPADWGGTVEAISDEERSRLPGWITTKRPMFPRPGDVASWPRSEEHPYAWRLEIVGELESVDFELADALGFMLGIRNLGQLWDAIECGQLVGMLEGELRITVAKAEAIEAEIARIRAEAGDPTPKRAEPAKIHAARVKAEKAGHPPRRKPRKRKEAAVAGT